MVNLITECNTMMNMIYDVLTFRKYVDFSTEMVKRHVTSGKVYVQRKHKKYVYDEFDTYMIFYQNTKHNQRNLWEVSRIL